jgi:hypothetical protein
MEQRAVVRFLTLKKPSAKCIRVESEKVDANEVLCLSAVKKWRRRLANAKITLKDDPRLGTPHKAISLNPGAPLSKKCYFFCVRSCARSFK